MSQSQIQSEQMPPTNEIHWSGNFDQIDRRRFIGFEGIISKYHEYELRRHQLMQS